MRALLLAGVVATGLAGTAQAAFIETATQTSAGVFFVGTGTLNTIGLASRGSFSLFPAISPQDARISYMGGTIFKLTSGPASFGTLGRTETLSASGDAFYLGGSFGEFGVPFNYISGATLNSSLTFTGATFTSLGLTPGTYLYTLNTGANADTITVQIGPVATTDVPEPASLALLGLGAAGIVAARRRAK